MIALQRLAEHIDPYPGITSTLWVPPIPGTRAQHWIFNVFASESTLGTQGRETTIVYTLRGECAGAGQPR